MKYRPLAVALLVVSFLGLADAWYLAQSALTNTPLTCTISGLSGCNTVAQSPYSHILGIPYGVYGVIFYAAIFILSALIFVRYSRLAFMTLLVLGWFGVASSIIFVSMQVFVIKALCVYCLGSAALAVLICILTSWLWAKYKPIVLVSAPSISPPPAA